MFMKYLWVISFFAGAGVLFFFPEPEANFLYYFLTGVFFLFLTIILFKKFGK